MEVQAANVSCIHPAHRYYRFLFLFLLCFMTFGSYWCLDIPDAIQNQLKDKYHLTQTKYALFYSVYNFMNIGIVLFGGYFIDVIGLRVGAILFCFLITLGQIVFSLGSNIGNLHTAYYVMLIGRVIFSLGGESLSVAQSAFAAKWFKGNELALAFGITLSFSRFGSFANLNATPAMANHLGISWAIWLGSLTCLVSLTMTVVASASDRVSYFNAQEDKKEEKPKVPFRISDVFHFPPSVWLIYLICVCFYVPIFTLVSISGLPYFEASFGYSDSVGNRYLSIPYLMSAFLAPFCGFAVDKIGHKPAFLSISTGLMCGTFALMLFLFSPIHHTYIVIVAMVLLGLSYSICAAALWPGIALLVPEERVGTAYAIMNAIQNGGLAIASVVVGQLAEKCHGNTLECNTRPIEFLALVSIAAFGFSVILTMYDLSHGRILTNRSVKAEDAPTNIESSESAPLLANNLCD